MADGMRPRDAARSVAEPRSERQRPVSGRDRHRLTADSPGVAPLLHWPDGAGASSSSGRGGTAAPGRGGRGRPASSRLFVAFIATSLVAVTLGVLAVGALLRGPSPADAGGPTTAPSATTDSPSPSASPAARAKVDGAFKFLERVGGSPVRWNPCDTISYAVNTDGATSSIEATCTRRWRG